MIISRTPLRISLGGGGTDLPSFYRLNGPGFLVAAAIDKYVYVAAHRNFEDKYLLKYSEIENVAERSDIRHPMIRSILEEYDIEPGIEISSIADIPAGTGLGSSGSFAVGLIKSLTTYNRQYVSNEKLAEVASRLEIEVLKEPVGKQDQYIAAKGGITAFEFRADESVHSYPVSMRESDRRDFETSLMLFYTGIRRSASEELRTLKFESQSTSLRDNLEAVRAAGYEAITALENGEIDKYGKMLSDQWKLKFLRQPSAVHAEINSIIESGIRSGAFGGKLIGAGGGGFILFSTNHRSKLRSMMEQHGMAEVPIRIDYEGSTVQWT